MNDPLVSVIMPAYNAAETIAESIRSVLGQTHRNLELIVVDDGSQDETGAIVRKLDDSRVILIDGPHAGVSAARNRGLDHARGSFVKYLDSDDLLSDGALTAQLSKLHSTPGLALCTSAWGRFYRDLSDLRVVKAADWQDLDVLTFLELTLGGGGTMPVMTWLIPRALVDKVGPWRCGVQLFEDTEYLTLLALRSDRVVFCEGAWGYYRTKANGTLSTTHDPDVLRRSFACVQHICDQVIGYQDSPRVRRMLANFWRRFTIRAIGVDDALAREAERQVSAYGGSRLLPKGGGATYRLLQRLLGWQTATRIRRWYGLQKWRR